MSDRRKQHNGYQRKTFDKRVGDFRRPISEDIQERTRRIVAAAELTSEDRVLDAGTGVGVLVPHIQFYGVTRIVGCDISPVMLAEAQQRFPEVRFWCGDVIDLPRELGCFDAVFFNAMFGNVCDQGKMLEMITTRLTTQGRVIISHPMGASFQAQLARENPRLVPHTLPDKNRLTGLISGSSLRVHQLIDQEQLFLCCLKQSRI